MNKHETTRQGVHVTVYTPHIPLTPVTYPLYTHRDGGRSCVRGMMGLMRGMSGSCEGRARGVSRQKHEKTQNNTKTHEQSRKNGHASLYTLTRSSHSSHIPRTPITVVVVRVRWVLGCEGYARDVGDVHGVCVAKHKKNNENALKKHENSRESVHVPYTPLTYPSHTPSRWLPCVCV